MSIKSFLIRGDIIPITSILKLRESSMDGELDYNVHLLNGSVYALNTGSIKDFDLINDLRAEFGRAPLTRVPAGGIIGKTKVV